jgi:hypothetical protein
VHCQLDSPESNFSTTALWTFEDSESYLLN